MQGMMGINKIMAANGGADVTIAIVDAFHYAGNDADLSSFRATMGLPRCTLAMAVSGTSIRMATTHSTQGVVLIRAANRKPCSISSMRTPLPPTLTLSWWKAVIPALPTWVSRLPRRLV